MDSGDLSVAPEISTSVVCRRGVAFYACANVAVATGFFYVLTYCRGCVVVACVCFTYKRARPDRLSVASKQPGIQLLSSYFFMCRGLSFSSFLVCRTNYSNPKEMSRAVLFFVKRSFILQQSGHQHNFVHQFYLCPFCSERRRRS